MFTTSSSVAMSTRPDVPQDNCNSPRIRNMTGVYLGTQVGSGQKGKRHNIPPLARPRVAHHMKFQGEIQRHLEVLRTRDEQRGFHPLPIKRGKPRTSKPREELEPISPRGRLLSPDYNQLSRKSSRSFTIVKNNGVSHVEYLEARDRLKSSKSENGLPNPLDEIVTSSRDLLGLDDVYNNVCRGNVAMLRSLLPQRRVHMGSRNQSIMAPLTVKSFKNPANPHTVVQYSEIERPKSTKGVQYRPPTVPAPYFYDARKMARATDISNGKVKVVELPNSLHGSAKILAAPGVGAISRQASSKHMRKRPPSVIEGHPPPTTSSNSDNLPMVDREPYKRVDSQETTRIDPPVPTATPTHERGGAVSPSPSVTEMLMKAQDSSIPGASSTCKDSQHDDQEKVSMAGSIQVSIPSIDPMQEDSRSSTPQLIENEQQDNSTNDNELENNKENLDDVAHKSENMPNEESPEKMEYSTEQVQETEENETAVDKTDSNEHAHQGSNVKGDEAENSGIGQTESSAIGENSGTGQIESSADSPSEIDKEKVDETSSNGATPSHPTIVIALEDDAGESQPVVIDDSPTETGQTDTEVSQNTHSSDEQLAEYIETANRKQTELQRLLEEHSQLCSEINDMEKHHGETEDPEDKGEDG